jgi:hypothetical protein
MKNYDVCISNGRMEYAENQLTLLSLSEKKRKGGCTKSKTVSPPLANI